MKDFVSSTALTKDIKRVVKRGISLSRFKEIVTLLVKAEEIPESFKDHKLTGNWNGYRELHVFPDLIFIYRSTNDTVYGERLGTHSDLFFKQRR